MMDVVSGLVSRHSTYAVWRRESQMIGIEHYLVVSSILFVMGVLGIFLNRKNVIMHPDVQSS